MAEGFGLTASPTGLLSLVCQVVAGIDTLRDMKKRARKAPTELSSLVEELTCLKRCIEEIPDSKVSDDDYLTRLCYKSCKKVVEGVEKLKKCFPVESELTGKQKVLEIFAFRNWKEDVEVLQENIRDAKLNLILYYSSVSKETMLLNQIHTTTPLVSSSEERPLTTPSLSTTPASFSFDELGINNQAIACVRPQIYTMRKWNCRERNCSCSCHHTIRINQRFWEYEYTSPKVFRQSCDNKSCTGTKYGGTIRLALSQLGFRWSAIIQFHVLAAPGKFLFRPALEFERIVPYTAPGFVILWKCQEDQITLREARDEFINLYRSDPSFKNHVNPGGRSYIEELLRAPWGCPVWVSKQYTLLELFMKEFGMTRGIQSTKFLARCAKWIGEGPHLELLGILLGLGLDPTIIDSPQPQDWPVPSSPDWMTEEFAPDPFFVYYQSMLLKDNQGFAGMTPLHEAVLLGSSESVNNWISRSEKDERNFLGQTPIHLAVSNLSHLLALVEAGYDLDAKDEHGNTPLMYAAAANEEASVIALLEAGANPHLRETRYGRIFMKHAAIRGHWSLILKVLQSIESLAGKKVAESWAQYAAILYFVTYPDYSRDRKVSLQQLLAMCGSADFTFEDVHKELQDSNLMHYVRSVKDVEILLQHGFTLVNQVDTAGQHSLMRAALHQREPEVVRRLLDTGAKIDHKDNAGHTTLCYILDKLQAACDNAIWETMEVLHILLANGTEILCKDSCKCPCSPDGCYPSSMLRSSFCNSPFTSRAPVWSMEWLSLILEHRGINDAKMILLSFIRKAKFDEMGMTHVCCKRNRDRFWFLSKYPSRDEDIDDIIDEESEFIEILENEMALSSAKEYESLLEDWTVQIKTSLENCHKEAMERNKRYALDKSPRQGSSEIYEVDHKNDRFIKVMCWSKESHPKSEAIPSIARYVLWMEHEYLHGNTSALEKTLRDSWYFSRLSWLHRLVNALEISTTKLVDRIKDSLFLRQETRHGFIDAEEAIQHFLVSWMLQDENRVLPVSEIDTSPGR